MIDAKLHSAELVFACKRTSFMHIFYALFLNFCCFFVDGCVLWVKLMVNMTPVDLSSILVLKFETIASSCFHIANINICFQQIFSPNKIFGCHLEFELSSPARCLIFVSRNLRYKAEDSWSLLKDPSKDSSSFMFSSCLAAGRSSWRPSLFQM